MAEFSWIDTGIMILVIGVVLGIFYKALKEPIDLLLGWIGGMLGAGRDKLADMNSGDESGGKTTITYG